MLEVLDPEQNSTFRDNYLAVPFDLSRVVFITTANMLETIPGPLRDRMEIIALAGYTAGEKLEIAKRYLVRRQLEANGLKAEQVEIDDAAMRRIIEGYTREAGVRSLEREIGRVLRHVAVEIAEGATDKNRIGVDGAGEDPGAGALRERGRHALERAGRGDGPCLDAGRRRHPVHRGDAHAGRRPAAADRPARRGDARERAGGAQPGQEPRRRRSRSIRRCSRRATSTSTCRPAPRPRTGRARAWPCSWRSPRCSPAASSAATPP